MIRHPHRFVQVLLLRAAIVCLLLVVVLPRASAQTIGVQSGEHADFTRLVLDIGSARSWRLEQEQDVVRLVLDPPVDGFDIARVFDRIPRTRLAGLVARDGLALSLACACRIDAQRFRGRFLLLDIRDAPPDAPDSARRLAAEQLPDTARLLLDARSGVPLPTAPSAQMPQAAALPSAPEPVDIDLEEAARIMAEQLSRAAAAGLLDASAGRPMSDADPVTQAGPIMPLATGAAESPEPDTVAPVFPPGLPIRAETALDVALPLRLSALPPRDGLACTGGGMPLREWSMGGAVQEGLGALRLAVFDARDQLQRDAVLALARHYLSFGFGAEAGFWLSQIDGPPPELVALAGLVDDRPGPHFRPEPDPLLCSDEELLWRYLDRALTLADLTSEEAGRLQRATMALPEALFDHIAPRMARALQADGFVHEARHLRDMLWRSGRFPLDALTRLDRDLGLVLTDVQATRDALDMALRDAGGDAVAAMAHAMALERETGMPVAAPRLDAAEALLREHAIGPHTAQLWQEVMLAHAALGDLDRMLSLLSHEGMPAAERDAALTALFIDSLARQDTPALFMLARLFGSAWQAEGSQAGRARVAAIGHLQAAGLLEAAAALRLGQRVLILPARPEAGPDRQDDLSAAWQSGDWTRLGNLATGAHRAIADRMEGGPPDVRPTDADRLAGDLPRLLERVADSRALRDEVSALLAAPRPVPAEPLE